MVMELLSQRETIGATFHPAENRLFVTLEHFVHPAVIRLEYPFCIAASSEVLPVPANEGSEETVNARMYSVLLRLFTLKFEEPISSLFRQKAA
jgi:hypothetical protein